MVTAVWFQQGTFFCMSYLYRKQVVTVVIILTNTTGLFFTQSTLNFQQSHVITLTIPLCHSQKTCSHTFTNWLFCFTLSNKKRHKHNKKHQTDGRKSSCKAEEQKHPTVTKDIHINTAWYNRLTTTSLTICSLSVSFPFRFMILTEWSLEYYKAGV